MFLMLQYNKNCLPRKIFRYSFYFILLLSTPLSHAAKQEIIYYHYVNELGEPFISTTMQPEFVQYGYTIKNINGTVIKTVPAQKALTKDEKKKQKALVEKKRREDYLVRLYGSAAAAERTRKSNVTTAEIKIEIIESNLMLQKQKLEMTENSISEFQQKGQTPPPELIEKQKQEAERFIGLENAKKVAEEDKKRMIEKYEKDIKSLQEMEFRKDAEKRSKNFAPMPTPTEEKPEE